MQLSLLQILHGNTACSHLPHLSGLRFSAAAYGQARARLPLRFFELLLERFCGAVKRSAVDDGRWHGQRPFLVDGSGCSMPDTPTLQEAFGQSTGQRPGCGFPVARLLGLFHEVRYHLGTPGFRTRQITLVTTLLDAAVYRADDLAELYRLRWQVETALAHLKTTMPMEVLHCTTVPGVLKELTVFTIVYNLVRMVIWQSAELQHTAVERISFLDALRWLSAPSIGMPLVALIVNPIRPRSGGAARQEAAAQELPVHDQTPAGTAPAVGAACAHRLT
jgi:hypothetical protein